MFHNTMQINSIVQFIVNIHCSIDININIADFAYTNLFKQMSQIGDKTT